MKFWLFYQHGLHRGKAIPTSSHLSDLKGFNDWEHLAETDSYIAKRHLRLSLGVEKMPGSESAQEAHFLGLEFHSS
jgi:hypothetical protein